MSVNDIRLPASGKMIECYQPFHQGYRSAFMIYRHCFDLIRFKKDIEVAAAAGDSNGVAQPGLSARKIDRSVHVSVEPLGVIKKL
jgi:hypothetical protein